MLRKSLLLLLALLLICGSAMASPKMSVVSGHYASTWLPTDANKDACKIIDDYLADRYFAVIFDGSKAEDRKELAKKIGQAEGDCVTIVKLTGFYDPPFTTAHMASDIKPSDTVATVLLDYSIYLAPTDKWVYGRIVQRSVFRNTTVPLQTAYNEAVRQSLPQLAEKLDALIK